VTLHSSVLIHEYYEQDVITARSDYRQRVKLCSSKGGARLSAYTNQSRVSHSVRMRENGAEIYLKQSILELFLAFKVVMLVGRMYFQTLSSYLVMVQLYLLPVLNYQELKLHLT